MSKGQWKRMYQSRGNYLSFQDIIMKLQSFWARQGCVILQPCDTEVGAGTFHTATALKTLGSDPWKTAYVQPCRRPKDGRYGDNPNRMQFYYQFQVIVKPSPDDAQDLLIESLKEIGLDPALHDLRFVEDNWEGPTLGASGLGWEVWCDGLEIVQFTYFQQMGGVPCSPVSLELTYGLERCAAAVQGKNSVWDLEWVKGQDGHVVTYGDIFLASEREFSAYNFEHADTAVLMQSFSDLEEQSQKLLSSSLPYPAYDCCLKASHAFNLLDARGVLSVNERAQYIDRVRRMAKSTCDSYLSVKAGK
jgi:glycyl-tRNA synthetase alpha chain